MVGGVEEETRSRTPYSEGETEGRDDGLRCAGNNGRRGVKREKETGRGV